MNLTGILLTLGTSLLLTLFVELAFAFLLGARGRSAMLLVALVNLATNPAVVYTYIMVRMAAGRAAAEGLMPFLEIGAVLLEAWLYTQAPDMLDPDSLFYRNRDGDRPERRRPLPGGAAALLFSVLLNAASYAAGEIINTIWK